MKGILYAVATPIGNLKDISLRALEILRSVDAIAAEDTRNTVKLLNHYDIHTPMFAYHKFNTAEGGEKILRLLAEGKDIALVSDAGLPGISDPGEDVLRQAMNSGFDVQVIPGATASLTALLLSGLSTERFVFEGFLPSKGTERRQRLQQVLEHPYTVILYEAPHRILSLLKEMEALDSSRRISVSRELTKKFEETFRGSVSEAVNFFEHGTVKGEFVVVVEGKKERSNPTGEEEIRESLRQLMEDGCSKKDAVRELAASTGLPKNVIYGISLSLE